MISMIWDAIAVPYLGEGAGEDFSVWHVILFDRKESSSDGRGVMGWSTRWLEQYRSVHRPHMVLPMEAPVLKVS